VWQVRSWALIPGLAASDCWMSPQWLSGWMGRQSRKARSAPGFGPGQRGRPSADPRYGLDAVPGDRRNLRRTYGRRRTYGFPSLLGR
jgi:hypothetical protein